RLTLFPYATLFRSLTLGAVEAAYVLVVPRLGRTVFVDEVSATQTSLKADELRAVGEIQPAGLEGQCAIQCQLRQTLIRCGIDDAGSLVGMHVELGCVAIATPGQSAALVKVVRLADAQLGIQILKIVGVADIGVIDLSQQA